MPAVCGDPCCIRRDLLLAAGAFFTMSVVAAAIHISSKCKPIRCARPYHYSAFTGETWVQELLSGHPERIKMELGMHVHVFQNLITALSDLSGLHSSKHVSLEEQLAIFLHASVTGLSICHLGER